MKKKKFIISIIGLPGSGKGTQGKMLSKFHDLLFISTGDTVKKVVREADNSEFSRQINELFLKGIPQSDENIEKILTIKLDGLDLDTSIVLDQFPLNYSQSKILKEFQIKYNFDDYCICYIKVPEEQLMKRLLNRKSCLVCGSSYGPDYNNYENSICVCGNKLVVRDDDKEEVIKTRFKFNEENLQTILDKYEDNNQLIIVNGEQEINLVQKELIEKLENYFGDV